jgi:anti-sigma regulatory factor (Ser/Thr protein kinase)
MNAVSVRDMTRDRDRLRLRIPARADSLARVRAEARRWLSQAGVDLETTFDLVLAVSDACANAVEHPIARRSDCVEIGGSLERGEIVVTVRDFGAWRDDRAPGDRGRGLPIINALVDDLDVLCSSDGTEVRLVRRVG